MMHKLKATVILICLLLMFSADVFSSDENISAPGQSNLSTTLVETAGEVLLEAAEFGLDWAGEKLLGSKGWDGFKRILSPVVARLQERFPALKFGKQDDPQSIETAKLAVSHLKHDPKLRNLLVQGFINLEQGQLAILASMDRLQSLVNANHEEQMRLLRRMDEKLSSAGDLPINVDVSDTIDRLYLLSKIRAKREGREFNPNIARLVSDMAGLGLFTLRVLEDGKAFVRYETVLSNKRYYATASSKFTDKKSLQCRKLTMDQPAQGLQGKRISTQTKDCQTEGSWRQVEVLERTEYFDQY